MPKSEPDPVLLFTVYLDDAANTDAQFTWVLSMNPTSECRLQSVIQKDGKIRDDPEKAIAENANKIVTWLEATANLSKPCSTAPTRMAPRKRRYGEVTRQTPPNIWKKFSDYSLRDHKLFKEDGSRLVNWIWNSNSSDSYRYKSKESTRERCSIFAAVYKAIYLFLDHEERYKTYDARLMYFLAVWQWYNAIKILYNQQKLFIDEFAKAHRLLHSLIESQEFAQALRWMSEMIDAKTDGALFRERIILSIHLLKKDFELVFFEDKLLGVDILENDIQWKEYILHDAFSGHAGGQTFIRSLITTWLLPRYDLGSTLHMAHLLKTNKPQEGKGLVWWATGGLFVISLIIVFLGSLIARLSWNVSTIPAVTLISISIIESLALGASVFIPVNYWMHIRDLPHLLLPRLIGGIILGYSAIVLQGDSIKLANALWTQGWFLPICCWASVLMVGGFYLYFDTLPMVREPEYLQNKEGSPKKNIFTKVQYTLQSPALTRMGWTLSIAVLLSALIGLVATAFTTAMTPDSCTGWGCFVGPAGWFSIQQYMIFVPLALFTGLVTQFIFEEKTVTASVWAPEEV